MWREFSDRQMLSPSRPGAPPSAAPPGNAGDPRRERASAAERWAQGTAQEIVDRLQAIDRDARRAGRTLPTLQEREAVVTSFWRAMRELAAIERRLDAGQRDRCAAAVREVLGPWLWRGRYWSRSYLKPHGYAGDFRMLEWMYDLQGDPCADPTQPAVVNVLDHLYGTVHSVRAVWHRRRWFAGLIDRRRATGGGAHPVRVLDLACGGSRYVRDSLAGGLGAAGVAVTFLDQDPAALAFVEGWLPDDARACARLVCGPVRHARRLIQDAAGAEDSEFDVVISTGLFDYLDDAAATRLLAEMTGLAAPGGLVAVCNFAPEDGSRIVKEWVVDWRLVYRGAAELRRLFGPEHPVDLERSPDGGLIYARAQIPAAERSVAGSPAVQHVGR